MTAIPTRLGTQQQFNRDGADSFAAPAGGGAIGNIPNPEYITMAPAGVGTTLDLGAEALSAGRLIAVENTLTGGAAETIQVRDSGGAPVGAAIPENATAFYYCDGASWTKMSVGAHD